MHWVVIEILYLSKMNFSRKQMPWYFVLGLSLLALTACKPKSTSSAFVRDWDEIVKRDTLCVLMENSASTFYNYKGVSQGFDFELMQTFCDAQHIYLKVVVMDNVDSMFQLLNRGVADVIASNITETPLRDSLYLFSTPLYTTRQVLVQRWADDDLVHTYPVIKDTTQLDSLTISVHRYTSFYDRLKQLEKNAGKPLDILEAPGKYSADDLIRLVSEGKIEATVTDASLAGILVE
ncbi:MAG: hypothetical protein RL062_164, partial [Bacteroidota bacterium]